MKIVYTGPSHAVVGDGFSAVRGEPFEVPDELGAQLLEQDIYKKAPVKKAPVKKAEKSPAVPAAPAESAAVPQEED